MKLILTESVPKLGEVGDVVTVKGGYGRNYLIPQGKARLVSRAARAELEHHKRVLERKRYKIELASKTLATELQGVRLEVTKKVGKENRIFGSVTTAELGAQLTGLGFDIHRRDIKMLSDIKKTGVYEAEISLPAGVKAVIGVVVQGDGTEVEEEVKEVKEVVASQVSEDNALAESSEEEDFSEGFME